MSNTTTIPDGYKRCSKGEKCVHPDGPVLPATNEYFNRIDRWCRLCKSEYNRAYGKAHPRKQSEAQRLYRATHREERNAKEREAYKANPDLYNARNKRYRQSHPDKISASGKRYHETHRESGRENNARYRQAHPDKMRAKNLQRKALKRSLPANFSINDHKYALEYFHGACAYCGNPPSLFDARHVLHLDHFIALANPACPGTVKTNMLPVCQDCNLKKQDKNPHEWLLQRFGKHRTINIEKRIQSYFDTLRGE